MANNGRRWLIVAHNGFQAAITHKNNQQKWEIQLLINPLHLMIFTVKLGVFAAIRILHLEWLGRDNNNQL